MDVTYADPQAGVHLSAGSADQDGSAASTPEARKCHHYARAGHMYVLRRAQPCTYPCFGRLEREGSKIVDQLATSVVGGGDGGFASNKGICKERQLQMISVTSQIAISPRVHRYKLALRGRQATREGRDE